MAGLRSLVFILSRLAVPVGALLAVPVGAIERPVTFAELNKTGTAALDSVDNRRWVRSRVMEYDAGEFSRRRSASDRRWHGTDFAPVIRIDDTEPPATARVTVMADFSRPELPISGNGAWRHRGTAWRDVRTIANHAVGTQNGRGGYDDSYAYLTGFGPDQTAQAVLWIDPAISNDYHEVELLLHWADSPGSARGYECNLAWNGAYAQIVRWNGPFGNFNYVVDQKKFGPGIMPPRTGDIFKASISGATIRVYLNKNDGKGDQLIATGADGIFSDGNPGIGFFIQGDVDPTHFGFSGYRAWSD